MLKKKDDTRVYLWVADYGEDASVVTQLIGLEPTQIKVPGQPNPNFPKMINRRHFWELYSPLPSTAHIDEHFEALLQLLEPHAANIRRATEIYKAGINSAVYYYEDFSPGIHLIENTVKVIASMNLSVDFDLYFFDNETET